MKQLFTLFIALMACQSYGQHVSFQKLYSTTGPTNQGTEILEQPNGDLLICGIRSVPMTTGQYIANIYLLRVDTKGDTVWTKEIGTSNDRELAYGMTQLPNGNVIIVGSINIPPDAATMDGLVVCTDANGTVLWQKRYGGNNTDYFTDITYDGQYLVASGITQSFGAGDADAWIVKMDTSGDTLWTRTNGGTLTDDAWGITNAYGDYYITGGTYSFANGQFDDAWVVKINASGDMLWRKTYGVKDRVDWAWSINTVQAGGAVDGFVLTGVTDTEENQPGNALGNLNFLKIDTAGNIVWNKPIGGTGGSNWRREGFDAKQMPNGNFVLCGFKLEPSIQSQQLYIVQTNSTGDVIWDTAYGTSDSNYYASALTLTQDGGWAVTGYVFHPAQPIRYIYVTKFQPGNAGIGEAISTNDVVVYPNPAMHGKVNISVKNITVDKVIVRSVDGRMTTEITGRHGSYEVEVDKPGMYLVEIITEKGVIRKKLTVL